MIASLKLKDVIPADTRTLKQLPDGELAFLRRGLSAAFTLDDSVDARLREVIAYVLSSEGSLMRAQLGYMSMSAAGADGQAARNFGVAVELFHTASLLFDDMPAMDNATYRRGALCPHVKFSEADATLAALALITQAYDLLFSVMLGRPAEHAAAAQKVMTECLGAKGILSGQSADVHYDGTSAEGRDVLAIASGKTGTLLRLLLSFPSRLYGMGDELNAGLEKLASFWGHAYQVLDDFNDCLNTESDTGKTVRRDVMMDRPNYLIKAGWNDAWSYLVGVLASSNELVRRLSTGYDRWSGLCGLQMSLERRALKFGGAFVSEKSTG